MTENAITIRRPRLTGIYSSFLTLPLGEKVCVLMNLGDEIRRVQEANPKTAGLLQGLYDEMYMVIGQEQADRAFDHI